MGYEVSVIVPVYNTAEYLEACLTSILEQTFTNFEIIAINDGSTDHSEEILQQYSTQYPQKLKYYSKPNGGLSSARNFGIEKATGDYLAFVDSDDTIMHTFLEEMIAAAKSTTSDIVVCGLRKVNCDGQLIRLLPQLSKKDGEIKIIDTKFDKQFFGELSCFACNKLFKSSLFNEIRFVSDMHFEDIATVPLLLLKAQRIAILKKTLYNYYERSKSITKEYSEKGLDILRAIDYVKSQILISNPKFIKSKEWRNFVILQGFYSFLAYYAFVRKSQRRKKMRENLRVVMEKNHISCFEILSYRRFGSYYLLSVDAKKSVYYIIMLIINFCCI